MVAIGARVGPLALAEAPHGTLVVVDTFFIYGLDMALWGPQGSQGLLAVLTTVGAAGAWSGQRGKKNVNMWG